MLPVFTLTPAAEKFMQRIVRLSGLAAGAGFRLALSAGGCSGYHAEFSAEAAPQADEQTLQVNGLKLFVSAPSAVLLDGLIVDFVDQPMQTGLRFTNPKQAACVCSSATAADGVATIAVTAIGRSRAPVDTTPA